MPIKLSQYRGILETLKVDLLILSSKNTFSQSKIKQTIAKEIFMIFRRLLIFLLVSSSWSFIKLLQIKPRCISSSVARIYYICVILTFVHHIWLYLILFYRNGDVEKKKIPGPKANSYQCFLFFNGI